MTLEGRRAVYAYDCQRSGSACPDLKYGNDLRKVTCIVKRKTLADLTSVQVIAKAHPHSLEWVRKSNSQCEILARASLR